MTISGSAPALEVPMQIAPVIHRYSTQRPPRLEALLTQFEQWYYVEDPLYLEGILATRLAIEFDGPPYWQMTVGAPGSGKTSVMTLLIHPDDPKVYAISRITPRSFLSGYNPQKEDGTTFTEYDVYPQIVGKLVIIKDFSNLNTMPWKDRQQLFAILRECYDGSLAMVWGSQHKKEYEGYFGMLVATTSAADQRSHMFNEELGERFVKYKLHYKNRAKATRAAWVNAPREEQRDRELKESVRACLAAVLQKPPPEAMVPTDIADHIMALADACAVLRTPVRKEKQSDAILEPDPEIGTRLIQQYWKRGQSIAYLYGHKEFGGIEIAHINKIAIDSMHPRRLDVLRILQDCQEHLTRDIGDKMQLPSKTALRILDHLMLLSLIERFDAPLTGSGYRWRIKNKTYTMLNRAKLL